MTTLLCPGRARSVPLLLLGVHLVVAGPALGAVVVSRVDAGGPGQEAGLEPGDRLSAWRTPDAGVRGELGSPFDLWEVELGEGSRGPIVVEGRRGAEPRRWTLPPHPAGPIPTGRWRFAVEPGANPEVARLRGELATVAETTPETARDRLLAVETRIDDPIATTWLRWETALAAGRHGAVALDLVGSEPPPATVMPAAQWAERRAEIARRAGDMDAMGEAWRRALALRPAGSPEAAVAMRGCAIHAAITGDPAGAAVWSRRSLEILERQAPDAPAPALDLGNLGYLAIEKGRLVEAEILLRRAHAIRERHGMSMVSDRWGLASLAQARGDWEEAERLLLAALEESREEGAAALSTAIFLSNLSAVAQRRGRLDEAELWERRALAVREREAPGSLDLVSSLEGLAAILLEREQRDDEARALLERALALARDRAAGDLVEAGLRVLMARLPPDDEAAVAHLERALEILRDRAPGSARHARAAHEMARRQRARGRTDRALSLYDEAVDALDEQLDRFGGTDEVRSRFRARFAATHRELVDLLAELGRGRKALEALERGRARGMLVMLRERGVRPRAGSPEDEERLRAVTGRIDEVSAGLAVEADPAARAGLRRELTALRRERRGLRSLGALAASGVATAEALDAVGMGALLEEGQRLVAFSVGPRRSWRFELDSGSDEPGVHRIDVGEAELGSWVGAFVGAVVESRTPLARRRAEHRAVQLGERLLGPGPGDPRLILMPDGPLHGLPFAALRVGTGQGARDLVELAELQLIDSATVWDALRRGRPRTDSATVLAIGDPTVASQGDLASLPQIRDLRDGGGLGLPSARREVAALAGLFGGSVRTLVGEAATENAVGELLAGRLSIVHFATHGLVDRRVPLESTLLLAVPEDWRPGEENGLLQAWEIVDDVRLDADLVALSACSTAAGRIVDGEGTLGLTRAFHIAGARSVLSSLWRVDDESTAVLMEHFYRELGGGRTVAGALRAAQVALRRSSGTSGGRDFSAPVHWAGFQVSGAGGSVLFPGRGGRHRGCR